MHACGFVISAQWLVLMDISVIVSTLFQWQWIVSITVITVHWLLVTNTVSIAGGSFIVSLCLMSATFAWLKLKGKHLPNRNRTSISGGKSIWRNSIKGHGWKLVLYNLLLCLLMLYKLDYFSFQVKNNNNNYWYLHRSVLSIWFCLGSVHSPLWKTSCTGSHMLLFQ